VPAFPGVATLAAATLALCCVPALAEGCPGRPDALGTARVVTIDPKAHPRVGSFSFDEVLPLADKEVVITFDDGPLPAYTASILQTLAAECVRATFFMVGQMARANPDWVRRVYNAGHTVGTHTLAHRPLFNFLPEETAVAEIERGIAAVEEALGDRRALAPFFRFPGLRTSPPMERYLERRGVTIWSIDFHGDDWRAISAEEVVERTMRKLERKGRGILLLHDIQARTALALPILLRRLKAAGYRVVHAVPAGAARPERLPNSTPPVARPAAPSIWPVPVTVEMVSRPELPVVSPLSFGAPHLFAGEVLIGSVDPSAMPMRVSADNLLRTPEPPVRRRMRAVWPRPLPLAERRAETPPVPSAQSLDLARPLAWQVTFTASAPARPRGLKRPASGLGTIRGGSRPAEQTTVTRPQWLNWIH
jgi:peptidoglycan/xylan/chitin deacetylase (PgdA/CDA1 family)